MNINHFTSFHFNMVFYVALLSCPNLPPMHNYTYTCNEKVFNNNMVIKAETYSQVALTREQGLLGKKQSTGGQISLKKKTLYGLKLVCSFLRHNHYIIRRTG